VQGARHTAHGEEKRRSDDEDAIRWHGQTAFVREGKGQGREKRIRKQEKRQNLMNKDVYEQLIKPRPYLWWWVSDKEKLSDEAVVEGVLANGDMEDLGILFRLLGKDRVREIFLHQIKKPRHNYRKQTVNFFLKVFAHDA
jgi:hypothetical protein